MSVVICVNGDDETVTYIQVSENQKLQTNKKGYNIYDSNGRPVSSWSAISGTSCTILVDGVQVEKVIGK